MAIDKSDTVTKEIPQLALVQNEPAKVAPAKPVTNTANNPFPTSAPTKPPTTEAKGIYVGGIASKVVEHPIPENPPEYLAKILSWPRKHGTTNELRFADWLKDRISELGQTPVVMTSAKNITVIVKDKNGKEPSSLFACHIDTVDCDTVPGAMKNVAYDANFGHMFLDKDNKVGSCLGADDGVGVWMLLCMIQAKVPGGYIFVRGEECGGIGAKAMVHENPGWLKRFDICVEFDRPRDNEIVTHQRGMTRCASEKFGAALASAINKRSKAFDYKVSDRGVYTDCYDWRGHIAECVNVGVGYENQHGAKEQLDLGHAMALMEAATSIDWEALPVDREPVIETANRAWGGYWGGHQWPDDADDTFSAKPPKAAQPKKPAARPEEPQLKKSLIVYPEDDVLYQSSTDVGEWVCSEPEAATEHMLRMAVELRMLRARIEALEGLLFQDI